MSQTNARFARRPFKRIALYKKGETLFKARFKYFMHILLKLFITRYYTRRERANRRKRKTPADLKLVININRKVGFIRVWCAENDGRSVHLDATQFHLHQFLMITARSIDVYIKRH